MSQGLGRVQMACLWIIRNYEEDGNWPTTYDIAAAVYQIKPDKRGVRKISDAQHVAIKRALEGLQRKGRIIGFRTGRARTGGDGRTELCHHWMTAKRAAEWIADMRETAKRARAHGGNAERFIEQADRVAKKAKAIGVTLPSHKL
jgi:hypothetical protein